MKVAVFGLGYVGTVCSTCLANHGHSITGVDVQPEKVELVNQGRAPVVEPGLQSALEQAVASGNFRATTNAAEALHGAEVILLCVGTPARRDGSLCIDFVEKVCREIGPLLHLTAENPSVAVRSTVPPGTAEHCRLLLAEHSPAEGFRVVVNPEFLREACALKDFEHPPYTLVGCDSEQDAEGLRLLYSKIEAPFITTATKTAELIKFVNNSFHALKITFANEVGRLCKAVGVDSHELMDLFCRDTALNISPAYLKPGFAYGGSCLPKDLAAINKMVISNGISAPVLSHIAESNDKHIAHVLQTVEDLGCRKIGFLGLSFKAETDDLRESAAVRVVENLLGKGYQIQVFDPNINVARLIGANRDYIENRIAHLSALLTPNLDELVEFAEAIVITNNDPAYEAALRLAGPTQKILDVARVTWEAEYPASYQGICW